MSWFNIGKKEKSEEQKAPEIAEENLTSGEEKPKKSFFARLFGKK